MLSNAIKGVACLAGALLLCGTARAIGAELNVKYRGIRVTDPMGRDGLRNPERGFRTETLIAEPTGPNEFDGIPAHLTGRVGPGFNPMNWVADIRRFEADGLTLAQTYCYLTEFYDSPISDGKLALLQKSFDTMRALGVKCVLRFAYIKAYPPVPPAPDVARILQHMDQLKPLLWANADVIHTLEAGFLSAWGEWHLHKHITSDKECAAILEKTLSLVPPDVFLQIRYPGIKTQLIPLFTRVGYRNLTEANAFTDLPEARLGHHDDGVLTHPKEMEEYVYAREPSQFGDLRAMVQAETLFVPMGGEMFWADQRWWGAGSYQRVADGLEAARYLRDYHFNVLSLAHSYSEREGKVASIDHWRSRPITKSQLETARLPIAKDWFTNSLGEEVERSQFEYIRDHLGYRLELQDASFTAKPPAGGRMRIEVTIINRGFSTIFHLRPVEFALISPQGEVRSFGFPAVDVRRWYPHRPGDSTFAPLSHTISFEVDLPQDVTPGHYSLGLWFPDKSERLRPRSDYAIRVANGDVPFWRSVNREYGINLIGEVQVLPRTAERRSEK